MNSTSGFHNDDGKNAVVDLKRNFFVIFVALPYPYDPYNDSVMLWLGWLLFWIRTEVRSVSSNHHDEIANTSKIAFLELQRPNNQPTTSQKGSYGNDEENWIAFWVHCCRGGIALPVVMVICCDFKVVV